MVSRTFSSSGGGVGRACFTCRWMMVFRDHRSKILGLLFQFQFLGSSLPSDATSESTWSSLLLAPPPAGSGFTASESTLGRLKGLYLSFNVVLTCLRWTCSLWFLGMWRLSLLWEKFFRTTPPPLVPPLAGALRLPLPLC